MKHNPMMRSEIKAPKTEIFMSLANWHHAPEAWQNDEDFFWDLIQTFSHVNFFNLLTPLSKH
jgi:hypothetical protein